MITSIASAHRFILVSAASTALLIGAAGCQQEVFPSNPNARAQGMKEYKQGNYADAAGSFKNAIRSDPRDYRSQFALGQCYENLKQYQQAVQAYKSSLDAQPRTLAGSEDTAQRLTTINALAACIAVSDQRDADLNLLEQQAKGTNKAQDYFIVAKIYQNRGDADSAIDAYNRATLRDPKDFIVLKEYGLYLEQIGQTQKAQQQLRKAYTLKTNDEQVNDALRRLYVVPGPGLKDENALAKPPLPQGPIPEINLSKNKASGSSIGDAAQPAATPLPSQAQTPRD